MQNLELTKKNHWNPSRLGLVILNFVNPNIVNFCKFPTSLAEGQLFQSFYHQGMGLLTLGLVSECRITGRTTNHTTFSQTLFNILRIKVEYFKPTLADTKKGQTGLDSYGVVFKRILSLTTKNFFLVLELDLVRQLVMIGLKHQRSQRVSR